MTQTPRTMVDSVVRSVCGTKVERLVRITSGGLNETYRAELRGGLAVIVRIARRDTPWFTDEQHLIGRAHEVGVPGPEVLGVEHFEHDGELLSFSVLELLEGRALEELADDLSPADLERLIQDAGEMMARIHSLATDRGIHHELQPRGEDVIARAIEVASRAISSDAGEVVRRGERHLRELLDSGAPKVAFTHGDFLPKHLLIHDGEISGLIDWEFAGSASPAFDLARWELSARNPLYDQTDLLRRGYARVADPDVAAGGWIPAFAIDYSLMVLGWRNPAPLAKIRRCVERIAGYTRVR